MYLPMMDFTQCTYQKCMPVFVFCKRVNRFHLLTVNLCEHTTDCYGKPKLTTFFNISNYFLVLKNQFLILGIFAYFYIRNLFPNIEKIIYQYPETS